MFTLEIITAAAPAREVQPHEEHGDPVRLGTVPRLMRITHMAINASQGSRSFGVRGPLPTSVCGLVVSPAMGVSTLEAGVVWTRE